MNRFLVILVVCCNLATAGESFGAEYHVSPKGNDADSGSLSKPCKTIQHIAERLEPGDICVIHSGIYRETVRPTKSGTSTRPITFRVADGEKAIVSGTNHVDGKWVEQGDGILKVPLAVEEVPQLFVSGQMTLQARWPNASADDLLGIERAKAEAGTDYEGVTIAGLPSRDLIGASILLWPGRAWDNATRTIVAVRENRFELDRNFRPKKQDTLHGFDPFEPTAGNALVIYDSLALLDSPGEWYFDKATKTLYWKPTTSATPEELEIRNRLHGFSLSERSNIHVEGIDLVGCGFDMVEANRCTIRDCTCRYPDYLVPLDIYKNPDFTNVVTGEENRIERCTFAYAALSALRVEGTNNTIADCVIHTSNYLGAHKGCIHADGAKGLTIQGCTISGSGRELVQFNGASKLTIKFCDLSGSNQLSNDTGALKCWGTDGEGSVIEHNWVHDNYGENTVGIYLDNFSKNFFVHHNVVWNNSGTGIRLNSPSNSNLVFHNTILNNDKALAVFTYQNQAPDQSGTRIINNLYSGEMEVVQGTKRPEMRANIQVNSEYRLPPRAANTVESAASPGRDQAIVAQDFELDMVGKAPDAGAYESGGQFWRPGPNMELRKCADWKALIESKGR